MVDRTIAIIGDVVKLNDLPTHAEVLERDFERDPEFRKEWERTAIGRLVANEVVRYRDDHKLSQRELAERLGITQSQVARLELGEHNPRYETMLRLATRLDLELMIDIRPAGSELKLARKQAGTNAVRTSECEIAVATA